MLVLVVGASGAGKDALIRGAQRELRGNPRFVFPRRVVTRQAVEAVEDHESVSEQQFALHEANGAYALTWDAHGLRYGFPVAIECDLAAGRIVVVNVSRGIVAEARQRFPGARLLLIEAAADVRAARLSARGRESAAEIASRLSRNVDAPPPDAVTVDNSGSLEDGVARFVAALRAFGGS